VRPLRRSGFLVRYSFTERLGWIGRGSVDWWNERVLILSPSGWVGLVAGLLIGGMNVYFSVHADSRFYLGRLGTSQPRGPELRPRILYRILFFVAGSFVIWDSVRQFLLHRG
jgi:hypothetical protein